MPKVFVDDLEVELESHEQLNGIQAAQRVGVEIPHYCWHPGLSVVASCRMCLVESGRKDPNTGKVSMVPKLVPACQTPATDGTIFVTNSDKVRAARAMVEEDLLLRHPVDCPICDKAGECHLQDYHFEHGRPERRADIAPFHSRRRPVGETVTLFVDRCVMCTRCVRFTREISGTKELMVANRGSHEEIDIFPGFPLDNKLAGNVVDLCPVGALGDVDFLYSQRVWFMKKHASVCAGCSTGCSIHVEENQDQVYRLKPRENPHVNQWWMCDEGRYGYHHIHAPNRQTEPRRRTDNGTLEPIEWSELPRYIETTLRRGGRLAIVASPFLTVEEAFLLGSYGRSISPECLLALGPVPEEGVDEVFANGFTIHAEKCPNRRGVEAILSHLSGTATTWDDIVSLCEAGEIDTLWIAGGYKQAWHDEHIAQRLSNLRNLIVQDLFASPLWEQATLQLPAVTFAERAGSYVNAGHRLQSFTWSIRPPAGAVSEGQLCWRLLDRRGLYRPADVLREIAAEIPSFEACREPICEHGVDLKTSMLVKEPLC
jgi:NADH-quinone oxidoreductase subunit G